MEGFGPADLSGLVDRSVFDNFSGADGSLTGTTWDDVNSDPIGDIRRVMKRMLGADPASGFTHTLTPNTFRGSVGHFTFSDEVPNLTAEEMTRIAKSAPIILPDESTTFTRLTGY